MVARNNRDPTLLGFLENFCTNGLAPHLTGAAGHIARPAQVQPGVYFTLEAAFCRVLALYSNCFGGAGVISSRGGKYAEIGDQQLLFLESALKRIKTEAYGGAIIIAVHHPRFCVSARASNRSDSRTMLSEIDSVCPRVGIWLHALLSAHSDNYQRFTRRQGGRETPYIVAGSGGHAIEPLPRLRDVRTPCPYVLAGSATAKDQVTRGSRSSLQPDRPWTNLTTSPLDTSGFRLTRNG